jgi:hypothetical protein
MDCQSSEHVCTAPEWILSPCNFFSIFLRGTNLACHEFWMAPHVFCRDAIRRNRVRFNGRVDDSGMTASAETSFDLTLCCALSPAWPSDDRRRVRRELLLCKLRRDEVTHDLDVVLRVKNEQALPGLHACSERRQPKRRYLLPWMNEGKATKESRGICVQNHINKPKATSITQTTPEAKTTSFTDTEGIHILQCFVNFSQWNRKNAFGSLSSCSTFTSKVCWGLLCLCRWD